MRARMLFVVAVSGLALLVAPPAQAASPNCTVAGGTLVQFPTGSPVWEFCVLTPIQSSGNDGSGIEIREAFYNGHKVMKRGHIPVLNVKYAPGGCGCFRDWFDSEIKFEVRDQNGNIVNNSQSGQIFDNASSVRTVCDSGGSGGDIPPSTGFKGVAIERLPDRMILTSQTSAGWYRYEAKWTFFTDGHVLPQTGYAATSSSCVNSSHHHNSYWRLDMDIDDSGNDAVGTPGGTIQPDECPANCPGTRRPAEPVGLVPLKVFDKTSSRGYHVNPHWVANSTYDPFGTFTIGDAWLLQYKTGSGPVASEIDDGNGLGGCPIGSTFLSWSNNESLDAQDVVVWYREGALHGSGQIDACARTGPVLEPFGDWSPGAP